MSVAAEGGWATLHTLPGRKRLRVVRQSEAAECGIACLTMVLSHHGRVMDLRAVRAIGGTSLAGSTLQDLVDLGRAVGLGARGVKVDLDALGSLRLPAILHWDLDHFVVLERVRGGQLDIVDPARGRRRFTQEQASEHFTGVALELWPDVDFRVEHTERRLRFRDLLRGTRGLVRHLGVIFVFSLTGALIGLLAPQYVQYAIDRAVVNEDPGSLAALAVAFVVLLLFGVGVSVLNAFSVLNLRTVLLFQFRRNLFRHLLLLPSRYFATRSVGDIMSRIDSYDEIQDTFSVEAVETVISSMLAIVIAVLLFLYSWQIFALVCLYAVLSLVLNLGFLPAQRRRTMEAVTARAEADSMTIESVRGSRSIKALAIEESTLGRWSTSQAEAINAELGVARLSIWQGTLEGVLDIANTIIIPGVALYLVIADELTLGMFYAVNVYKGQLIGALESLIGFALQLAQDTVHLERLADIALEEPEGEAERTAGNAAPVAPVSQRWSGEEGVSRVALVDVSFRHAESRPWVLDGVTLALEKGERIGLVGASGAGKSTLLDMLSSLARPVTGALEVDGRELAEENLRRYRGRLGIVGQDESLFAGSLASNIARQAERIDMARVIEVCRLADVHEEIEAMPMGYRTTVGDMGMALSTGQRQRVLLARALYAEPDFLLLDEGTSHLDTASEKRILARLDALEAGIVFAVHGEAALAFCDRVYRLEAGKLALVRSGPRRGGDGEPEADGPAPR